MSRRILALTADGWSGSGGIAEYNRALFEAWRKDSRVQEVVLLPRHPSVGSPPPPRGIRELDAPKTRAGYWFTVRREVRRLRPDLVFCGHIHLLPAVPSGPSQRAPTWLQVHGIEIHAPSRPATRRALDRVDLVTAVSRHTRRTLLRWTSLEPEKIRVLSNSVDRQRFHPGPKCRSLADRYGLKDKTVLLTVGRMAASEAYKGQDRVLQVLPKILEQRPDVVFVLAGDGDDRERLEQLSRARKIDAHTRFVGWIPEEEKRDLYCLADAFVMPSTGEGFGIAFLEAAACGTPVLGGNVDGSVDALAEGRLGKLVNPTDLEELEAGILEVLDRRREVPCALEAFTAERFQQAAQGLLTEVLRSPRARNRNLLTC